MSILTALVVGMAIISGCTHTVSTTQVTPTTPTMDLSSLVVATPTEQQFFVHDVFTPQVTQTISLGQLLQENEDEEANLISKAIDYTNPTTRDFAVGLVKNINGGSYAEFKVNQICDIWDAIRPPHWTYVNDTYGQEYYSSASETINIGLKGDCDDFAILNAAVVQSIGGRSKIITACDSKNCHAYAVMYINNNEADLQSATNYIGSRYGVKTVYYLRSYSSLLGPGYWLNLDWSANNPGGEFFNDNGVKHVFYPNGAHYVSSNLNELVISQTVTPIIVAPTFTLLPPDQRIYATTPTPAIQYDWAFKLTT